MYNGLPIATNKISIEEQKSIRHHLLGFISLHERPWEVASFRQNATQAIEEINSRGKIPILVGGTHYYTQALLFKDDIIEAPPADVARQDWEQVWPILGASTEEMIEELRKVDPVMAARWHPKERRRIKRSLEIYLTTGKRASETYQQQRQRKNEMFSKLFATSADQAASSTEEPSPVNVSSLHYDTLIFWTHVDSGVLKSRLEDRVEAMVLKGLIVEAQLMFEHLQAFDFGEEAGKSDTGIRTAIGYKEFLPYLLAQKAGNNTTEELENLMKEGIERTKIGTRQYARQQIRWIRNKLLRALENERLDRTLFLLDGTDLSQRSRTVDAVAHVIMEKFLNGETLPLPKSISTTAEQMLLTKEKEDLYARYCDACGKTMMSGEQWAFHIKGRPHLRAVKCNKDSRTSYSQPISATEDSWTLYLLQDLRLNISNRCHARGPGSRSSRSSPAETWWTRRVQMKMQMITKS